MLFLYFFFSLTIDENVLAENQRSHTLYATSSTAVSVTYGNIALTRKGEDFALCQLARGISAFSGVLDDRINEFQQLLDVEDGNSESESEADVRDDESDSDIDDLGNDTSICVIPEDEKALESITGEVVYDGVICWKLPASVSQSTLVGNDGSNACSIIATLLGNRFMEGDLEIPDDVTTPLSFPWINTICECISIGNMVYDIFRETLPSRYLSIEEAIEILSGVITAEVIELLPVRFMDPHKPSTIEEQLERLVNNDKGVAQFIIHERTSAFLVKDGKILYADSHLHPPSGAVLVSGSKENLHNFCSYIWNLEAHGVSEFGNFARTSYPDT